MKIIHYDQFYKKDVSRKWAQFRTPLIIPVEEYFLPKVSAIHYIPENSHEYGIDITHSLMRNIGDRALVYHVEKMETIAGKAKHMTVSTEMMMKNYHKRYKDLIRVRNIDKSNMNDRLHMVVSYALLPHLYIQLHNNIAIYQEWQNLRHAMWNTITELGKERYHFIPYKVPHFIPAKSEFAKYSKEMTVTGLKQFHTKEQFDLLELWKLLEDASLGKVLPLSNDLMKITNLVFIESGKVVTFNMMDLVNWAVEQGDNILRSYYTLMDSLLGLKTSVNTLEVVNALSEVEEFTDKDKEPFVGDDKEIEPDKTDIEIEKELMAQADMLESLSEENDEKSVDLDLEEKVFKSAIEERIEERALAGSLSGAEQRGLIKLSERVNNIIHPFNPALTLKDTNVTLEDIAIVKKPVLKDVDTIIDKSMLESSVNELDKAYVKKLFHKDMLNACKSIQNAGLIIKDIKVTQKSTAVTETDTYAIQIQPIAGKASTIKFTVPRLRENGSFLANGVNYRMDKLRSD